jgi:hypothetical protein
MSMNKQEMTDALAIVVRDTAFLARAAAEGSASDLNKKRPFASQWDMDTYTQHLAIDLAAPIMNIVSALMFQHAITLPRNLAEQLYKPLPEDWREAKTREFEVKRG